MQELVFKSKDTKEYVGKDRAKIIGSAEIIAKITDTKICGMDYHVTKEDKPEFPVGLILGDVGVAKEDKPEFPVGLILGDVGVAKEDKPEFPVGLILGGY